MVDSDEESFITHPEPVPRRRDTWIPRCSLVISIAAFVFQTAVLYPWHLELSHEFLSLRDCVRNASACH